MNTLSYKGYSATINYSEDDEEFFGSVINLASETIYFGGKSVKELKANFREAVEGHLENCAALGITPEKPYSGRLTYRTTPEQHAQLTQAAALSGKNSLNAWMDEVLAKAAEKVLQR